jgi:hypothetical protein
MKPIQEFLSELAALDVKLWADGINLRCNAPQGIITSEIRAQLSDRKAEIIKFLEEYAFHPKNQKLDATILKKYIAGQNAQGRCIKWNLAIKF